MTGLRDQPLPATKCSGFFIYAYRYAYRYAYFEISQYQSYREYPAVVPRYLSVFASYWVMITNLPPVFGAYFFSRSLRPVFVTFRIVPSLVSVAGLYFAFLGYIPSAYGGTVPSAVFWKLMLTARLSANTTTISSPRKFFSVPLSRCGLP